MANAINGTDLCSTAKLISNTPQLRFIYALQCVVGLLVLFPNMLTLLCIWRLRVFHANLRLIMANMTCNLLIFSTSTAIKAIQRSVGDACTFPSPVRTCIIWDWTVTAPLHNVVMSLISLMLERLYATVRYRTYDYSGSTPLLGAFLVACSWAVSLSQNVPNYFQAPADVWIPVCDGALAAKPRVVARIVIANISLEAVAAVITISVYVYNRYMLTHVVINKAKYRLAARYQIIQNVQLNKALMPGLMLHVVIYLSTYTLLSFVFVLEWGFSIDQKMWLLHLTFLWRQMYALLDPVIMMTLNTSFRRAVKKTAVGKTTIRIAYLLRIVKKQKTKPQDLEMRRVMNIHFDYLRHSWETVKRPL